MRLGSRYESTSSICNADRIYETLEFCGLWLGIWVFRDKFLTHGFFLQMFSFMMQFKFRFLRQLRIWDCKISRRFTHAEILVLTHYQTCHACACVMMFKRRDLSL